MSVSSTPIMSLAISGRPVLQKTVRTSGKLQQLLFDLRRHGGRTFQGGRRKAIRLRSKVSLFQLGHELAPRFQATGMLTSKDGQGDSRVEEGRADGPRRAARKAV